MIWGILLIMALACAFSMWVTVCGEDRECWHVQEGGLYEFCPCGRKICGVCAVRYGQRLCLRCEEGR